MAKVITLCTIVAILMLRPQGLFALKVREDKNKKATVMINARFFNRSELIGLISLALLLLIILPLTLDIFRLNLVANI